MDDATFEGIRDAAAPGRDTTSRLGAMYLLELSLDGDERIPSLLATLLRDRNPEVAAAAASVAYSDQKLTQQLARDLARAFASAPDGYRQFLIERVSNDGLASLAMEYAMRGDLTLRLGLIKRLPELAGDARRRDAALYLTHDAEPPVRQAALADLGASVAESLDADRGPLRAAVLRLLGDPDRGVRCMAVGLLFEALTPEDARDRLMQLVNDDDLDVRSVAMVELRRVQEKLNRLSVEPLVIKQRELVDNGEYDRALAVAAQVFMRVADHAGCHYQMARASAGLGDVRRCLNLLVHAIRGGFRDAAAVEADPLFATARGTEAWPEVLEMLSEPGLSGSA